MCRDPKAGPVGRSSVSTSAEMSSTDKPRLISLVQNLTLFVWPAARERQVRTDIGFALVIAQVMVGIMVEVIAEVITG